MASTKDIAQNQLVLARIKRRYLTSYDALMELGVARLAARIHDLKADGHIIKSRIVEVVARNGRIARVKAYKLAAPELLAPHNATTDPAADHCARVLAGGWPRPLYAGLNR